MRRGGVLAVLASAQLLIALDHNIVYVALPEITAAFGFRDGAEQWVVSAYALGFGGLLLAGGRIADSVGAPRVFVAALAMHGVAALAGGAAGSGAELVAARALQGAGSALLFPATLAILNTTFQGAERARALAVWGAAGACGGAFGTLLGGILTGWLGWRSVLLCAVPIAFAAAFAGVRVLPRRDECHLLPPWGARGDIRRAGQAPSALAGTCAATLAILALGQGVNSGWPAVAIVACVFGSGAAAAGFVALERRAREPLIPPAVLRDRSAGAATILAFAFMAAFGAQFYLLAVHLQESLGLDPAAAGAAFLPLTLATLAGTQAGGVLLRRTGSCGTAVAGALLGSFGLAACGVAIAAGSTVALAPAMVVDGLGQGIMWSGVWALAGEGLAAAHGVATGVVATSQQLGGAAGLALWVTLSDAAVSFLVAAAVLLAAAAAVGEGRDRAL